MKKDFLENILESMTLEEKLAQLSQFNASCMHIDSDGELTGPATELKLTKEQIKATGSVLNFREVSEVIEIQKEHLENNSNQIPLLFMLDVVHGYKTIYPIPLALGATFNPKIVEECCEMASEEMSVGGVNVTFAPMVDLVRDPRWGRCMETTGEDPHLNCEMAKAMVIGFQRSGKVAACVKHFAGYGQVEAGLDYNRADMSEQTLRTFYLPAYKAAIDADVEMVMTAYTTLNGIPSSGNRWLVNDILRGEWGFDKIIISDYSSIREMKVHGYCETEKVCAYKAISSTIDIEMMSTCYLQEISGLIKEGKVTEKQIDEAALRVLKLKERLGLFENPYSYADEKRGAEIWLCEKHRQIAEKAAEEGAVLLKNDNVLPFCDAKTVAVIGPFADEAMLGAWNCLGKQADGVSVLQGVKNLFGADCRNIFFERGCGGAINEDTCNNLQGVLDLARRCDCVILCVGENSDMSGESMSRAELRLSKAQRQLIKEVTKTNPMTATVVFCGRPLVLTDIIDDVSALVVAWQPGTEGGNALAKLLFGKINFSGKLPMTFPRSEGQIPISYNSYRTNRPWEGQWGSWYQDMPKTPLYPFGYGLSYTLFEISDPILDKVEMHRGESIKACVMVKNIGERGGATVLQLYICDEYASIVRPIKELKAFRKVFLDPQEEKEISIEITEEMLKFWTADGNFDVESGDFVVWISDSSDIKNGVRFHLA